MGTLLSIFGYSILWLATLVGKKFKFWSWKWLITVFILINLGLIFIQSAENYEKLYDLNWLF